MAITLSYTFSPNTTAQSSQVNANFSTLATRALDKTGDTMTGNLLFTDNTYDIGASGATRPRDLFLGRNLVVGGSVAGNLTFSPDATYDIGASGATRPRDIFQSRDLAVGRNAAITGTLGVTGATTLGDFRGTPETITATGTVNDQALGATTTILRCNNATDLTLTGITGGAAGRVLVIYAVGAGNVFLKHQNTGSTAANRLINFATSADTPLSVGGSAVYVYDGTSSRWRLVGHEQGAFIEYVPTFTTTTGTWTVTNPDDIITCKYRLSGTALRLQWNLNNTSTSSATQQLIWTLPLTFTAKKLQVTNFRGIETTTNQNAYVYCDDAGTQLKAQRFDAANWSLLTNNLALQGQTEIEVN